MKQMYLLGTFCTSLTSKSKGFSLRDSLMCCALACLSYMSLLINSIISSDITTAYQYQDFLSHRSMAAVYFPITSSIAYIFDIGM